jgi:hypothetical protein
MMKRCDVPSSAWNDRPRLCPAAESELVLAALPSAPGSARRHVRTALGAPSGGKTVFCVIELPPPLRAGIGATSQRDRQGEEGMIFIVDNGRPSPPGTGIVGPWQAIRALDRWAITRDSDGPA